jgi:hypothetical protein
MKKWKRKALSQKCKTSKDKKKFLAFYIKSGLGRNKSKRRNESRKEKINLATESLNLRRHI